MEDASGSALRARLLLERMREVASLDENVSRGEAILA
jgi:hypothetical protein